jgi:diketogulonate reductase-like aldo/keto reductase
MATAHPPSRREFLLELAALGALASRPGRLLAQERLPTRPIPGTGESLPIVGLGSSKPVLEIPREGTEPLAEVIRTLAGLGGRVVDTSPRSEEIDARFGEVLLLPDLRDRLFLATKINTDGAEAGVAQMRQMQRTFGRRTMDLVQVEALRDLEAHWPNLVRWKETGEARYIGVTVASDSLHEALEAFMRQGRPDFVHLNYSVAETRAEERLLPLAADSGMAVLVNRPFMNGSYFARTAEAPLPGWAGEFGCTSWAQFSLKYILANPGVTCVLTETSDPGHMDENARAGLGSFPDDATRRRMREVIRRIL